MMRPVSIIFLCIALANSELTILKKATLDNPWEQEEVVPDVIDAPPAATLTVTYPENTQVNLGNELTPTQVKTSPNVSWEAENSTYYTLALVDPDAPSRLQPTYREVRHWLIGNILGNDLSSGVVVAEYLGSAPPLLTGLHRYVFLLYQQGGVLDFGEPSADRKNFSVRKFADEFNLGQPIAGNFFQAQWDLSVGVTNKKR